MKNELYHYATSFRDKGLEKIPSLCFWILLFIFLVPILLTNMILGLILPCFFILLYFVIRRESDVYNKALLRITLYLLFLGIEFSVLINFQYRIIIPLITAIGVSIISYEIIFFLNIRRRVYSNGNCNKRIWINIFPLIFGGTGIWAGKLIAKSENIDIKLGIIIGICSLIIMYSFTFFQRFVFHKIIK